jgi:molecular chaperone DnaK (HSP70)
MPRNSFIHKWYTYKLIRLQVIDTDGDAELGGDDFTRAVAQLLLDKAGAG